MTKPVLTDTTSEPTVLEPADFTADNDPFRVRLHFSSAEKVQMVLVLIFIVPIRVLVAFISLGAILFCHESRYRYRKVSREFKQFFFIFTLDLSFLESLT